MYQRWPAQDFLACANIFLPSQDFDVETMAEGRATVLLDQKFSSRIIFRPFRY
jgi:hypothetical protein